MLLFCLLNKRERERESSSSQMLCSSTTIEDKIPLRSSLLLVVLHDRWSLFSSGTTHRRVTSRVFLRREADGAKKQMVDLPED